MEIKFKRILLCTFFLLISISINTTFFSLGCIVDIFEQLRFALGNLIYVLAIFSLLTKEKLHFKNFIKILPTFFILNIICFFLIFFIKQEIMKYLLN